MSSKRRTGAELTRTVFTAAAAALAFVLALVSLLSWLFSDPKATSSQQAASGGAGDTTVTNTYIDIPFYVWIGLAIFCSLFVAGLGVYLYGILRIRREAATENLRALAREQEAIESASGLLSERMGLASLFDLNRLLLDSYHRIATKQAEDSFRSGKRAMWLGFGWLLACFTTAVAIASTSGTGSQILLGSLAAVGATLSGFLGRTYIRVYERSLVQLNQYFTQPLRNSYFLSAERIIDQIADPAVKDRNYETMLVQLLNSASGVTSGKAVTFEVAKPRRLFRPPTDEVLVADTP